jgi:hypothetical protein
MVNNAAEHERACRAGGALLRIARFATKPGKIVLRARVAK